MTGRIMTAASSQPALLRRAPRISDLIMTPPGVLDTILTCADGCCHSPLLITMDRTFARLDIDDDLRGDQVKSLVRGIESGMRHESENIYRVDIVPIGRAHASPQSTATKGLRKYHQ